MNHPEEPFKFPTYDQFKKDLDDYANERDLELCEESAKDYQFDTSKYTMVDGPVRCAKCGFLKQRTVNPQSVNESWLTKLSLAQFGYTGELKDEVIRLNKETQKLTDKLRDLRRLYAAGRMVEFENTLKEDM